MDSTGGFLSKSNEKDQLMDKNTRNSSFGKWVAPINLHKLNEQVELHKQDYYTKKANDRSLYQTSTLFPPTRGGKSSCIERCSS